MSNVKFDAKSFNPQAFRYVVGRIPNLRMNEIRKSRALAGNPDVRNIFSSQNGTAYARIALRGLLDGDALNYDGETDITATSTKTFEQGMVVTGRAKAWIEKDFSFDITAGVDFMHNVAAQVADYKDWLDQDTILAVLEGIFSMSGVKNEEFVKQHTTDVTGVGDGKMTATSLNTAAQRACGANKRAFSIIFMHSVVATNLENMQLLEYLKFTDKDGVQRDLAMATWNGRLVIIDDEMPVKEVGDEDEKELIYTSYLLGIGSIIFEDIGAKVEYEMQRDPKTNGGEDTLYMRQRKVFSPFGISYEKKHQVSLSPTDDELKNGANWTLVHSGEEVAPNRSYINHRAIPIARIISRG